MGSIKYAGKAIVSLPVINLAKSTTWYRYVLGFRILRTLDDPPWCEMMSPTDGLLIGLAEVTEVRIGDTTLSLAIECIEECRDYLASAKADVSDIVDVPGIARIFSTLDPDGHTIMFREGLD